MSFLQMVRMFYLFAARRPSGSVCVHTKMFNVCEDVFKRLQKLGFNSSLDHAGNRSPQTIASEAVGIVGMCETKLIQCAHVHRGDKSRISSWKQFHVIM